MTSLMALTPGLMQGALAYNCVGGAGVWCNPNIYGFNFARLDPRHRRPQSGPHHGGRHRYRHRIKGSIQGSGGGYSADIATHRKSTFRSRERWVNRKPAAPRLTS